MTQTILSPAQLWPGVDEDDKSWTPLSDPEEDMTQRPALLEKWAFADQSFRDSYHSRAPLPNITNFNGPRGSKRFICLVDKPYDPENYSRITKLYGQGTPAPQLPAFIIDPSMNISTTTDTYMRLLAPENLPASYYLETADFGTMAMTCAGHSVFPRLNAYEYVVIDNRSCQDGHLCLLNFAPNGQVACQARVLPFRLGPPKSPRHGPGHLWSEIIPERPETRPRLNPPIDLYQPLLEIMAVDYTPAEWVEEFERFAPEFLQYEHQGRATEYSWDRLADVSKQPFITYSHLRYAQQLAVLQGRGSA
ncbi:hypothetical protein BJX63DRAFT_440646 [Aspergillus granulosus]|uniref:Uncharacterized protein n=1 Tax=Aspergillus granulosus TaxID=176169 RepID=A0ABR4GUN5_9EURO